MSFWAYMLHCKGGYFYVGQTDDLDCRVAQHESGSIPGFTRDHLPVRLVWSEEFGTRIEAVEAERRIKGWTRAKKLALIRGDWSAILRLARAKDRASTGSAQTEALVESLVAHPDYLPRGVERVSAAVGQYCDLWRLDYVVTGGALQLAPPAKSERTDGLWRTTCFELFVRPHGGEAYWEFNFAPSSQWAAYRFDRHRQNRIQWPMSQPLIETRENGLSVVFDPGVGHGDELDIGLSAVIEEIDGNTSYWALAHPPGAPDFHAPDCFVAQVPPQVGA